MQRKLCFCCFFLLLPLFLSYLVLSTHHENPANVLVDMINRNRTARKLPKLNDSPGLGCMALQFAESCKTNCSANGTAHCSPSEDDFTEIFAPNCGVELPTLGPITGQIVGCRRNYVGPPVAFSELLFRPKVLANRSHSEVGVGLVGRGHGPFFWCVLFGGGRVNSSFVLENGGVGIRQKRGCYSGSSFPCSAGLINDWDFSFGFVLLLLVLSSLFDHSII